MGYRKAVKILPPEVVALIQQYVDGEYIYIPRKEENRKSWGEPRITGGKWKNATVRFMLITKTA